MKKCDNYEVKIWLGHRVEYTDSYTNAAEVWKVVQKWCNEKKQCVTATPTKFIYVDGNEPGTIIGFINYPRYPFSKDEILKRALELGEILRKKFKQIRVTVSTPDTSFLLEDKNK
jgi:hypothetical protein